VPLREESTRKAPVQWVDADFGDTALAVYEFDDGMFTVVVDDDHRLLVNADQMQQIVGGFLRIGKEKGWT
jgi:hypothetical protein